MFKCASCGDKVSDGAACSSCKRQYDFGCAGITEVNFRKLGERKSAWKCLKCRNAASAVASPASDPKAVATQLEELKESLAIIMKQLAPMASLVEDVKTIKLEMSELKSSLKFVHESTVRLTEVTKTLEKRIEAVEVGAVAVQTLQTSLEKIQQDLLEKEQWARANNVEIKGVPLRSNENLYDIALKIGNIIQCPIRKEDINYIARVPSLKSDSQKSIIMALNNRYAKEEFVAAARKHRELPATDLKYNGDGKIYINDHLTLHNKSLLKKAKDLAKEKNFKYIWVKHCKILAKKSDTSHTFRIKSEQDLQRIG